MQGAYSLLGWFCYCIYCIFLTNWKYRSMWSSLSIKYPALLIAAKKDTCRVRLIHCFTNHIRQCSVCLRPLGFLGTSSLNFVILCYCICVLFCFCSCFCFNRKKQTYELNWKFLDMIHISIQSLQQRPCTQLYKYNSRLFYFQHEISAQ